MDLELNGKTAIVTGGSRGIGRAIARELALCGCSVVILARNAETLRNTADELSRETGASVTGIVTDVTDTAAVEKSVALAAEALGGRIDVLVNNAAAPGGLASGAIAEIDEKDLAADLDTKVIGYVRFARAVAPYMKKNGWGRIINIGGNSSRAPGANLSAGMRNAALVPMTKSLADELGPVGITVNVVHPGATWTERSEPMYKKRAESEGVSIEEIKARAAEGNAVGRIIDAREVAWVVAFLASPRSSAIAGEVISASGGAGKSVYY
ncbi:MAG: SDR family oxidoreductase [Spirochaetaceae bacterium]|nr:MAG: SDR family oxidoreductase [Spirochaetaceae bacterium]